MSNNFSNWYDEWTKLARFNGPYLPDMECRIRAVSDLWSKDLPCNGWKRDFDKGDFDRPRNLCTPGIINRRSDQEKPNNGEHQIEMDIINNQEVVICFSCFKGELRFEPIVTAFPCAKDSAGGRKGDVEVDLLGICKSPAGAIHPLICEVKSKSNNPWYALVENLRQLKLFIGNLENNLKAI
jgi:hypothetical protein